MYRADNSGSTMGKSGRRWQWDAGDVIEEAEKGELDHVEGLSWDAKAKSGKETEKQSDKEGDGKPLDGTKAEIKEWLDANKIEYDPEALKAELLEILEDA